MNLKHHYNNKPWFFQQENGDDGRPAFPTRKVPEPIQLHIRPQHQPEPRLHPQQPQCPRLLLGWLVVLLCLPRPTRIRSTHPQSASTDFLPYLTSISDHHNRFEDIINHVKKENSDHLDSIGGQCEALVACLREVPALYFKEDFALEDGATFRSACPFRNVPENLVLQEKLSHYLDVVELHLVKEISLRSNSFFEARGQLQDLNVKIVVGCCQIRELKETILLLAVDLVASARKIHDLNETRSNLLALQQKLRLILYVNQALSALNLLVASADCAGALDVTDDLQHFLDGDELTGLHCFHHLRDRLAASIEFINSILSAEFMRASIHDSGDMDVIIISRAKARASILMNGEDGELIKVDDEETSNFQDRLLPIIIGLLRTAKLPSVLRSYRDQLTADMKTAIKNAVAELLPILVSRPLESDFTPGEQIVDADGIGASLANKLRILSSESFVQLLSAIFFIVRAHLVRAAEVKKAIEWIMCNLDEVMRYEKSQKQLLHGRWAKLLGVRALLHPKLRLQEFLSIYNITEEFITATEKIGGRLGFSIRGTLQSQAKAFIDFQHESRMAKIKAVLDQETWVEVDVPDEFQVVVNSLFCSESLVSGNLDAVVGNLQTSCSEVATSNNSSYAADTGPSISEQQIKRADSSDLSVDVTAMEKSTPNADGSEKNKSDVANSVGQNDHSNMSNMKEQRVCAKRNLMITVVCNFQASDYSLPFTNFRSIFTLGHQHTTSQGQAVPGCQTHSWMHSIFAFDKMSESSAPNWGQPDEFMVQRFGAEEAG